MSSVAERLTADEYLSRDDPRRTELVDGIVVVNEPGPLHQRVCGRTFVALDAWTRAGGHGEATLPLDVPLDERNVLAPDVLWFAQPLPDDAPRALRPPDLAVEVRSPSTWRYDIGRKRQLYLQHGVRELWLVDTASHSVLVCAGDQVDELGAEQHLTSKLLPGFRLAIAEIFPG